MSVPRPARLRPGPGERDVTTSIKPSRERAQAAPPAGTDPREAEKRGQDTGERKGGARRSPVTTGRTQPTRDTHRPPGAPRSCSPTTTGQGRQSGRGLQSKRPSQDDRQTTCLPPISWYNLPTSGRTTAGHGGGGHPRIEGGLPEGGRGHTALRRTPSPLENRGGPSGRPHAPPLQESPVQADRLTRGRPPRTGFRPGTGKEPREGAHGETASTRTGNAPEAQRRSPTPAADSGKENSGEEPRTTPGTHVGPVPVSARPRHGTRKLRSARQPRAASGTQ